MCGFFFFFLKNGLLHSLSLTPNALSPDRSHAARGASAEAINICSHRQTTRGLLAARAAHDVRPDNNPVDRRPHGNARASRGGGGSGEVVGSGVQGGFVTKTLREIQVDREIEEERRAVGDAAIGARTLRHARTHARSRAR